MRFLGRSVLALSLVSLAAVTAACNTGPKDTPKDREVHPESKASPPTTPPTAATPGAEGALHLGAPIESTAQSVSLTDVAKNPNAFMGKTFATTGTVTAVCQSMGCWMEIKDDSGAAHIKMAGHKFFVPKTASGRKARVLATLEKDQEEGSCADDDAPGTMAAAGGSTASPAANGAPKKGGGCKAEAEAQLGRPLAKLELVAEGVELM